ncbi:hypothetical protein [Ilyomonas limi]|uniref:hypothetical protein n=1 Tax=Ilyomonas limi TaxID=2575867 RepID=UPI001485B567|nr:hypothetical protein [Ilyomonas limi]
MLSSSIPISDNHFLIYGLESLGWYGTGDSAMFTISKAHYSKGDCHLGMQIMQ